jgi:hypothetical protein
LGSEIIRIFLDCEQHLFEKLQTGGKIVIANMQLLSNISLKICGLEVAD